MVSVEGPSRFGIPTAANLLRPDVAKAHLPTGQITVEMVLRLVITQFGVRLLRRDWAALLREPAT